MTTTDTKNWVVNLTITTVVAALMAVGGAVWFFRALGRAGDTASIDCDRTRNDCVFAHGEWRRTIPLPELKQAQLKSLPLIRPDRRGQYVEVSLRSGAEIFVSGRAERGSSREAAASAVEQLNQFLSNSTQPRLHREYPTNDPEEFFPASIALFSLIIFAVGTITLIRNRRSEKTAARGR